MREIQTGLQTDRVSIEKTLIVLPMLENRPTVCGSATPGFLDSLTMFDSVDRDFLRNSVPLNGLLAEPISLFQSLYMDNWNKARVYGNLSVESTTRGSVRQNRIFLSSFSSVVVEALMEISLSLDRRNDTDIYSEKEPYELEYPDYVVQMSEDPRELQVFLNLAEGDIGMFSF